MARPRSVSDEQIVEAARAVFLERGVGATTAEIARRVGVAEGTLFTRYATKADLFEAAVGLHDVTPWRDDLPGRVGTGRVRDHLEHVARRFLEDAARVVPRLTLMLSQGHAPDHNPLLRRIGDPVRRDLDALAAYLRAEMALGRVRPQDAGVAASALLGALTQHVYRELLAGAEGEPTSSCPPAPAPPADPDGFVSALLGLLWPGLTPQP
ncbi:TetR/AcrR family transcriptional regulator [Deinococcus sp. SDU3-2]|uniref:TetR/AcrR family transcriptional regulator n=1 Tax=Deinococcus terrestris TaxID=2651870 RepID=A0A7X1NVQ0_9DEIO|nr:TetR/AcrR family transcriptional regulator [Deinococcus terrestris]MPY66605.1 TetR/AcrR family transcriptional regulator [Deinococcus terrestris]